jgi:tetratricopeptide (TPR) repeat protein
LYIKTLSENHPNIITLSDNNGRLNNCLGEFDNAINYHNKALEIVLNMFGDSHPEIGMSYYKIYLISDSKGEYDEAQEYYEKVFYKPYFIRINKIKI